MRFLSVLFIGFCSTVIAHPHSWITVTSDFVLDEQDRLVEIRQRWIFDEFYSMMTVADMQSVYGDVNEQVLSEYVEGMMTSLTRHQYFSHLRWQGQRIALPRASRYYLSAPEVDGMVLLILEMHFTIEPLDIMSSGIEWQVFDPTYYVSMMHETTNNIRVISANSAECTKLLNEADPDPEVVAYAMMLDETQTETDGLGELFAETVELECF